MSKTLEQVVLETAAFSSACNVTGCVEVAVIEVVAVRDSKAAPDGPVLWFSRAEWDEFVTAIKTDALDLG